MKMHIVVVLMMLLPRLQTPSAADDPDSAATAALTSLADAFIDGIFAQWPELMTFYGIAGAEHDALSNPSIESLTAWHASVDDWYAQLEAIDPATFEKSAAWVTYGFLQEALQSARQVRVCRGELWNVDQMAGWQVMMPLLADIQPTGTPELRSAALRRFSELPAYVDAEIQNLRDGLEQGYSAPRGNAERVLDQVDAILEGPPASSPFFGPARSDSSAEFTEEISALISDVINPAVRRYRDFVRDEYLPQARSETAVAAVPGGEDCYRALTRQATSLDLTPAEIHEIGLETMASITAEMRIIAQRSFGTEDVAELLDRLRTDPAHLFADRGEIERHAAAALARAQETMPRWFGRLPQAHIVVEPFPPHEEASAPLGAYVPPADDGSRPGIYRINLFEPERQPRAPLESVVFHEAIPGHHLQIALAMERPGAHAITRLVGSAAFSEGWALYSERLADEMGLYSSDLDRMGMLSSLAFRAGRLVVDSGLHALGWTRERAIDYLLAHTMESAGQIEAEVDRYIIMPGQATAYMIGNLEILRLRGQAEEQLADRFRLPDFHDEVLGDGAVTLPMLQQKIARWIAASRN